MTSIVSGGKESIRRQRKLKGSTSEMPEIKQQTTKSNTGAKDK